MLKDNRLQGEFDAQTKLLSEQVRRTMQDVFNDFNARDSLEKSGAAHAAARKGIDVLHTGIISLIDKLGWSELSRKQCVYLEELGRDYLLKEKKFIINECVARTGQPVAPYVEELINNILPDLEIMAAVHQNRSKIRNSQLRAKARSIWPKIRPVLSHLLALGLGLLLGKYLI
ncbi:MAG: hypothetical protein ABRQ26_09880 [Syntrophomonadaceae bacterium]